MPWPSTATASTSSSRAAKQRVENVAANVVRAQGLKHGFRLKRDKKIVFDQQDLALDPIKTGRLRGVSWRNLGL